MTSSFNHVPSLKHLNFLRFNATLNLSTSTSSPEPEDHILNLFTLITTESSIRLFHTLAFHFFSVLLTRSCKATIGVILSISFHNCSSRFFSSSSRLDFNSFNFCLQLSILSSISLVIDSLSFLLVLTSSFSTNVAASFKTLQLQSSPSFLPFPFHDELKLSIRSNVSRSLLIPNTLRFVIQKERFKKKFGKYLSEEKKCTEDEQVWGKMVNVRIELTAKQYFENSPISNTVAFLSSLKRVDRKKTLKQ